jgi:hypothetical protein
MSGASDCPVVSMIVHRLKYLFLATTGAELAGLLFGPLADWIYNTPSVPQAAHDMAVAMAEPGTIHYKIALRMCTAYDLMGKITAPAEAHVPYMVGVFMDLHVPSMDHNSIHEIYSNMAAPEQVPIASVSNDEVPTLSAVTLSRLWRGYDATKTTAKAPRAQRASVHRKTRRKPFRDIPHNCLLPDYSPVLKVASVEDSAWQMLYKGMYGITTTRNIVTLFNDAMMTPEGAMMWASFSKGVYRHATVIAPPHLRRNVPMCTYKPGELTTILAEFIAANTRHYVAMNRNMCDKEESRRFYETAMSVSDRHLRQRSHGLPPTRVPRAPALHQRVDSTKLFWTLVERIGVRTKIKASLVVQATQDKPAAALYNTLAAHPNRLRLYGDILENMGMSDGDCAALQGFNVETGERATKTVARVLAQLSVAGKAKLYIYLHYVVHRAQLGCHKVHTLRRRVDVPKSVPYIHVCNRCHSIRSQCRMVTVSDKSVNGTALDITSDDERLMCTDCFSRDVSAIDMRDHYVHGVAPGTSTRRCTFCMCQKCGVVTEYRYIIGLTELCRVCYHNTAQHFVVQKCLCGRKIDKRGSGTVMTIDEEVVMAGLCHRHLHLKDHCHPHAIMPIAFYHALM